MLTGYYPTGKSSVTKIQKSPGRWNKVEEIQNAELIAAIDRARIAQANTQVKPIGQTSQTPFNYAELEKCGIYKRYWHCTFEEMEKRGIPQQVRPKYGEVKNYAANIAANIENGIGLILKGPVGTMKTSLAAAVLIKHIKDGGSGLFVPMASLLDNLFTMKERNKEEWVRYEQKIRNTSILVLDDLGAEYHQEWVLSKVDSIISDRYDKMKPIIMTTNLSGAEIKGKYAERVYDRLKSTAKVINFAGESLREAAV